MNKKLEINQYHGLPGAGIIGVQGETGGDGYNILVGEPASFFDGEFITIEKWVKYGHFDSDGLDDVLYWNPYNEYYDKLPNEDPRKTLDFYVKDIVRYAYLDAGLNIINKDEGFDGQLFIYNADVDFITIEIPSTLKEDINVGDTLYFLNDKNIIYDYVVISEDMIGKTYSYVYSKSVGRDPFHINNMLTMNNRFIISDRLTVSNNNITTNEESDVLEYQIPYNVRHEQELNIINANRIAIINKYLKQFTQYPTTVLTDGGKLLNFNIDKDMALDVVYDKEHDVFIIDTDNYASRMNSMVVREDVVTNIDVDRDLSIYKSIISVLSGLNTNIINLDDTYYKVDVSFNDFIQDTSMLDVDKIGYWGMYIVDRTEEVSLEHLASTDMDDTLVYQINKDNTDAEKLINLEIVTYLIYDGRKYTSNKNYVSGHYINNEYVFDVQYKLSSKIEHATDYKNIVDYPKIFTIDYEPILIEKGSSHVTLKVNNENIKNLYIQKQLIMQNGKLIANDTPFYFNWLTIKNIKFDEVSNLLEFDIEYTDNVPGNYETLLEYYTLNTDGKKLSTYDRKLNIAMTLNKSVRNPNANDVYFYDITQAGFIDRRIDIVPTIEVEKDLPALIDLNQGVDTNIIKSKSKISFSTFNYEVWNNAYKQLSTKGDLKLGVLLSTNMYDRDLSKLVDAMTRVPLINLYKSAYISYDMPNAFKYSITYKIGDKVSNIPFTISNLDKEIKGIEFNNNIWYDFNYLNGYEKLNSNYRLDYADDLLLDIDLVSSDNMASSAIFNYVFDDIKTTSTGEVVWSLEEFKANNYFIECPLTDIINNEIEIETTLEIANPVVGEHNVNFDIRGIYIYSETDEGLFVMYSNNYMEDESVIFDANEFMGSVRSDNMVFRRVSTNTSGNNKFILSPLYLTALNPEYDNNIKDITFNNGLYGSDKQITLCTGLSDIDTFTNLQRPKKYGLQDNVTGLDIEFAEVSKDIFTFDFTKMSLSDLLEMDKGFISRFLDKKDINDMYYTTMTSDAFLKVVYNSSILLPNNKKVKYNDVTYDVSNYNQFNLNKPLYTNGNLSIEYRSKEEHEALLEFNKIYENSYEFNETGLFGGMLTGSGNGYLKLKTDTDFEALDKPELNPGLLIELKLKAQESLFSKDNNIYISDVKVSSESSDTPQNNALFRTLLWDFEWAMKHIANYDNDRKVVKSYTLTNPYVYDVYADLFSDESYIKIEELFKDYIDRGMSLISNYDKPLGFNEDKLPILTNEMYDYIKDIDTLCKHVFGKEYEDDIIKIKNKDYLDNNDNYKLELYYNIVNYMIPAYDKVKLILNDVNMYNYSNSVDFNTKNITRRATTITSSEMNSLLIENKDNLKVIELYNSYSKENIKDNVVIPDPIKFWKGDYKTNNVYHNFIVSLYTRMFRFIKPNIVLSNANNVHYEPKLFTPYNEKIKNNIKLLYNADNVYNVLMIQQPTIHSNKNYVFNHRFYKTIDDTVYKRGLPYNI